MMQKFQKTLCWILFWLFCSLSALAQNPANSNAANQVTPLLQAPTSFKSNSESRVFAPARIFQKSSPPDTNLNIKERPVAPIGQAPTFAPPSPYNIYESSTTDPQKRETNPQFGFEFSEWVKTSIGKELSVFGSELIHSSQHSQDKNSEVQFPTALDPLTVPDDYRVGPGDELIIQAWGQIDIDFQGPIQRSGTIFLPKVGQIVVAGQKISDLRNIVESTVAKQYKNFSITVTLGRLRNIQFYVTGFAKNPGIHTVPSTATALYGLIASGGALPTGDLRRVEIKRDGKLVSTIDTYQFLAKGNKSIDIRLQPGDVLHVPALIGQVAVAGNVKRSSIYYLTKNSTLEEMIELAGGLSIQRDYPVIHIESQKNGNRTVEKIILNSQTKNRLIQDAEILIVLPSSPQFTHYVTLRGSVEEPLRQNWFPGMRISDLLKNSQSLVRYSTIMKQNSRVNLSNLTEPNREVEFKRDYPEVNWDYAVIERIDSKTQSQQLISFNLAKAMDKDAVEDKVLESGDSIVIFSMADFKQPQKKKLNLVRIEGEVNAPGVYSIESNQNLHQIIQQAGGLTSEAFLFGMIFTRESAKKDEAQRIRDVADRIEQDYLRTLASRTKNAMTQEEGVIGSGELEVVKTLIARLRDLKPEGRIALNLRNAELELKDLPALKLEDLDSIIIPPKPSTVSVVGAVFRQGTLLWTPNAKVNTYIENSGGYRSHADQSGVVILRADGVVKLQTGWGSHKDVNPGDTIIVPEDVTSVGWSRIFRDWSQIFYQLGLGGAALKVLRSGL